MACEEKGNCLEGGMFLDVDSCLIGEVPAAKSLKEGSVTLNPVFDVSTGNQFFKLDIHLMKSLNIHQLNLVTEHIHAFVKNMNTALDIKNPNYIYGDEKE
ncbi:MAG TPA: hypothetical protein PLS56_01420 [Candidatus Dojkabacteria bacterium]|nr:hypothetical protein [Candidatus Dojkabacteria bacterium]